MRESLLSVGGAFQRVGHWRRPGLMFGPGGGREKMSIG